MMMGGGLLIGLVFVILLLLVVGGGIAAVVWFVAQSSHGSGQGKGHSTRQEGDALEILRQRYARGEIDRQEFERMREEIRA